MSTPKAIKTPKSPAFKNFLILFIPLAVATIIYIEENPSSLKHKLEFYAKEIDSSSTRWENTRLKPIKHSLFAILSFVLFSTYAHAATLQVSKVISVYDGDTIRVDLSGDLHPLLGSNIGIRLRGIDTPEIRGKCDKEKRLAIKARDFLRHKLGVATTITLKNVERGKYFRLVADVYADGEPVASKMILEGLGRPYDGGKREGWCE